VFDTNKVAAKGVNMAKDKQAYELIDKQLKSWKAEFDNPDSLAHLYGLTEVDMIYHIHELLAERGL
jgi:hypothetical protein